MMPFLLFFLLRQVLQYLRHTTFGNTTVNLVMAVVLRFDCSRALDFLMKHGNMALSLFSKLVTTSIMKSDREATFILVQGPIPPKLALHRLESPFPKWIK